MTDTTIVSPAGVLAVLSGVCALFFYLEHRTQWKVFNYLPPLIWIYMFPLIFSNTGIIPSSSEVYSWLSRMILPMILVILLLDVNVKAAFKVIGKGVFVMLFGTLGIVVGAPIGYVLVKGGLGPEGWKAFGTLAGSWIGGTGNMAAVSEMIQTGGTEFGLAVLADSLVYIVWLPILLGSKNIAAWFARFTSVSDQRIKEMEMAARENINHKEPLVTRHVIFLLFLGLTATFLAEEIAALLPNYPAVNPFLTQNTWKIFIITIFGVGLSLTPAHRIPGSHAVAMALVYLFVANMGAKAHLEGLASQAPWFLLGSFVMIFIHGMFCLLGAKLFKVDVHTAAIASAANIGGAASAPIVAAYHLNALVPVSILMALIGYAVGNPAAYLAAILCRLFM